VSFYQEHLPNIHPQVKKAFSNAQQDDNNLDLDADLDGFDDGNEGNGEDEDAEPENDDEDCLEFGVGDTIGKALALVNQVIFITIPLVSSYVLDLTL